MLSDTAGGLSHHPEESFINPDASAAKKDLKFDYITLKYRNRIVHNIHVPVCSFIPHELALFTQAIIYIP